MQERELRLLDELTYLIDRNYRFVADWERASAMRRDTLDKARRSGKNGMTIGAFNRALAPMGFKLGIVPITPYNNSSD